MKTASWKSTKTSFFQSEYGRGDLDTGEGLISKSLLNVVFKLYHQVILRTQPCREEECHEGGAPTECQVYCEHLFL